MHIEIKEDDVGRSQRLRKCDNTNGRSRPIFFYLLFGWPLIANFAGYNTKSIVFYNKKKLKGKNVSIKLSLTKERVI